MISRTAWPIETINGNVYPIVSSVNMLWETANQSSESICHGLFLFQITVCYWHRCSLRLQECKYISHARYTTGLWFNIKISSYKYRKYYCGDKTVIQSFYLHNVFSYTGKMASSYWIGARRKRIDSKWNKNIKHQNANIFIFNDWICICFTLLCVMLWWNYAIMTSCTLQISWRKLTVS